MNGKAWSDLLAPIATVLAYSSVVFSVGVYVGRNHGDLERARLEQQLYSHMNAPRHPDAVSRDVLDAKFAEMARRLDRIEAHLQGANAR